MKKNLKITAILSFMTIACMSCESNDDSSNPPTAAEFKAMETTALNEITQHFTFDTEYGLSATSARGVMIHIDENSLMLDGTPITGMVDLEFIEIFDAGTMAVTNKPSRGITPDGALALLISGGEFFIKATQNGEALEVEGMIDLVVPAELSGEINDNMILWEGVAVDTIANNDNEVFVWNPAQDPGIGQGVFGVQGSYFCSFANFGWTNVDCFYSDPRAKTTILVGVPSGYTYENSRVYLSYDGQGHSLASLDTPTSDGLFSEHYGQIPIGLECHVIFMTIENGAYRYGIKAATITAGQTITISMAETTTGTKEALVAAINAVQN
jgi:hypothetical protein